MRCFKGVLWGCQISSETVHVTTFQETIASFIRDRNTIPVRVKIQKHGTMYLIVVVVRTPRWFTLDTYSCYVATITPSGPYSDGNVQELTLPFKEIGLDLSDAAEILCQLDYRN